MAGITLDFVTAAWESRRWLQELYPEDLPEGWRLAYYSNEFPAVLLPVSRWRAADEREIEGWAADTPDSFRFYLELAADPHPPEIPQRFRRLLGERLSGGLWRAPAGGGLRTMADGPPLFCLASDFPPTVAPPCLTAVSPADGSAGDLALARQWLTDLNRSLEAAPVLVVVEGERCGPDDLRRWWELAWLLGLA
jgi:hypothetical protein